MSRKNQEYILIYTLSLFLYLWSFINANATLA
jgi:hypothetical protein